MSTIGLCQMKTNGFTLIEILVVMVILSLTTTLLISGLSTTWSNFERLNTRQLKINALELPKVWFNESFANALHSHPHSVTLEGAEKRLSFVTFSVPNDPSNTPQSVTWSIKSSESQTELSFSSKGTEIVIATIPSGATFRYLNNGAWVNTFSFAGKLPKAVRIITPDGDVWTESELHRDTEAYYPPELKYFGKYEY